MSPVGFEPTIPASERPQTDTLGRGPAGLFIGILKFSYSYTDWTNAVELPICTRYAAEIRGFNLLKSTGYLTYHQVLHSEILCVDYIAFICFVWLSEQTDWFL